ncbi:MAG: nucleotide exchange factor GrpE [Candidatus Altiarchaeota archaeon]
MSSKKKDKLKEYVETLQRLQAEFENYKKRAAREREDYVKYAKEDLIVKFLDVVDDFDRASAASETSKDYDALRQGLLLTSKKLHKILADEGVEGICAVGEVFDPVKHEALLVEHSEEHDEDVVTGELARGYTLKSKVIRPSKVKVCKKVN